ncbi:hypothetical protein A0257_11345 [Hymenobacter psoromatis]|nr:hypothetical protein A0257_11345 [Hymenobacter psoromatis]
MHALAANQPQTLELQGSLLCPYALTLPPGYALVGASKERCSLSFSNGDGLGLTANNRVQDLALMVSPTCRAIYSLTGWADMGTMTLTNLTVTGQVSLMMRLGTTQLTVLADKVDVVACDARRYSEQPQKYGVNVLQGAFTVYNFNSDAQSLLTATLTAISVGRLQAPVLGSGVFVSGFGDAGGQVKLTSLTTGPVYTNGLLPFGTADVITAGVFIVFGVQADAVASAAEVVTYGVNDMVLDNWGHVTRWLAAGPLTSYGPSGIGFVNFGTVNTFEAQQDITTYGLGARGFNQYDGTVQRATFKAITTHGDGSIGMQVSKPVGTLEVQESVTTYGALGTTLVKGVLQQLPAEAFSVKPGGEVQRLVVGGDLVTHGAQVNTYAIEGGTVAQVHIGGQILATGPGATAVLVSSGGRTPLTNVKAQAPAGQALCDEGGTITDKTGFEAGT